MSECLHGLTIATCSLCRPQPTKPIAARRPTTVAEVGEGSDKAAGGTKDVSMPVHALDPYLGEQTDWMPCVGGYPHDLRPDGWLYLRCDGRYGARARVVGLEWRDERPYRTGAVEPGDGFGPGLAFVIDEESWMAFSQAFGDDADNLREGYRYHRRVRAGELRRFRAGEPILDGDWED